MPLWPPKEVLDSEYYLLSVGDEIAPEDILKKCIEWGYERVKLTTTMGEISRRGDVVDVFVSGYDMPIRIEFFGDIVESMRTYDPITQRSKKEIDDCVLLPVSPVISVEKFLSLAKKHWNYLWKIGALSKKAISYFEESISSGENNILPGLFYLDSVPLTDYFSEDAIFFLVEPEMLRRSLEDAEAAWKGELLSLHDKYGFSLPMDKFLNTPSQAKRLWLDKKKVIFDSLVEKRDVLALPEQQYYSFSDIFWRPEDRKRPLSTLINSIVEWNRTKNQVVLCFRTENSKKRFLKLIEERLSKNGKELDLKLREDFVFSKKGVFVIVSPLSIGISLDWNHVLFLSEAVLFPAKSKVPTIRQKSFKGLKDIDEIKPGDFLVHRDYGIGLFKGLTRIHINEVGNDYLELEYAGADKLFVPVDKLNLIQKYKGPDGVVPTLDRLGSSSWSKTRARVKKAIESIAQDLVKMYAYRKVVKGFKYPPIDEDFREFEATFPFEETPDQERAIEDVLRDMERDEPMDRLVCGDVGFGKTEIAMRAAYRAVSAGRQVALLCPTTVLAEQHFRNFKSRMEDFGVNVAMLSRFVSKAKQKKIIEAIKRGEIDIVIGTHRLLSEDIEIPRLGLFILDEEQRFGVRQKEKLKQMRKNIDVLTLTATPIPRTLQLSLAGIRELSVIETPPVDRKPVETSIIERNKEKLKEILKRELDRGGQVFWVYNRVRGLLKIKDFVKSIMPDARVEVAHGQMSERRLEETLHLFLLGEIDILVCTAIIEAGLDFPRANTLIVDTPQLFGLGQLYQLRGRVGRSSIQAYAYFVVDSLKKLSDSVIKRLKTILDLDYLGAGFKVAMADLKLRGAGNLLGEAQTGNIAKVGLDLYLEMLNKEIKRLKGEVVEEEFEPQLNIFVEANIPSSYIPESDERLKYYKWLSSCKSREEMKFFVEEIKDRFGSPPEEVLNLISILEFKHMLVKLSSDRADFYKNRVILSWEKSSIKIEPEKMLKWIKQHEELVKLITPKKIELGLKEVFFKSISYWHDELESLFN
jgi:transcription-repair coupling factor (superfamily II helicase)